MNTSHHLWCNDQLSPLPCSHCERLWELYPYDGSVDAAEILRERFVGVVVDDSTAPARRETP